MTCGITLTIGDAMVQINASTQGTRRNDGSVDVYVATGVWLGWANSKGEVMSTGFLDRERYVTRIHDAWRALNGEPS